MKAREISRELSQHRYVEMLIRVLNVVMHDLKYELLETFGSSQ